MKKLLTGIGILVLVVSGVAQNISVEPSFGINVMPLPRAGTGVNHKIAFHGNVTGNYKISEKLSVNFGLGISDRRMQYKYSDSIFLLDQYSDLVATAGVDLGSLDSSLQANGINLLQYNTTYGIARLQHLEIPIYITYNFGALSIDAGGYLGFLIHSSKVEEVNSRVPLLETIDIASYDTTGLVSFFLPKANETTSSEVSNTDNLDTFIYGLRFGLSYSYKSNWKYYGNFNMDLNSYTLDNVSLVKNNKYFIRFGIAYTIHTLKLNKEENQARFE